ncbi:epoxide hydrolase [Moniliophthora roreri]|nr:epoxide hydrolase [Moniliophthora roreri]
MSWAECQTFATLRQQQVPPYLHGNPGFISFSIHSAVFPGNAIVQLKLLGDWLQKREPEPYKTEKSLGK